MSPLSALSLGSFARLAARGLAAAAGLARAWDRRRLVGQLGQLDDAMLRDIGITRQDIQSVLAEPLYRDRTAVLAARAAERRGARRAIAALSLTLARRLDEPARPAAPPPPVRRAA